MSLKKKMRKRIEEWLKVLSLDRSAKPSKEYRHINN
jgi:hypothetical protein